MTQSIMLLFVLGVFLGLAAHRFVFIYGEWHIQSPNIVLSHVLTFICLSLSKFSRKFFVAFEIISQLNPVFCGYLAGLFTSIAVYRCFLHSLTKANFPGPWYSTISTIWNIWASRDRKYYLALHALHEKYGDFVRTGKDVPCKGSNAYAYHSLQPLPSWIYTY
jgi:hypothetical protein